VLAVPHRVHRRREAVEPDHAQVPDGRRAVEDVERQPDLARRPSEHPVAEALVDRRQREYGDRQQEVAHRQVADQVVRHRSEVAVAQQRDDHEEVSGRRSDDDDEQKDGDDDHCPQRVVERHRGLPAGHAVRSVSAGLRLRNGRSRQYRLRGEVAK